MLLALLVTFMLGGGSIFGSQLTKEHLDNIGDRIEIIVENPETTEATDQILKRAASELKSFEKSFSKSGKVLKKQYQNHEDTSAEMLAELESLSAVWEAAQSKLLEERFALKNQLTEEQWKQIFEE